MSMQDAAGDDRIQLLDAEFLQSRRAFDLELRDAVVVADLALVGGTVDRDADVAPGRRTACRPGRSRWPGTRRCRPAVGAEGPAGGAAGDAQHELALAEGRHRGTCRAGPAGRPCRSWLRPVRAARPRAWCTSWSNRLRRLRPTACAATSLLAERRLHGVADHPGLALAGLPVLVGAGLCAAREGGDGQRGQAQRAEQRHVGGLLGCHGDAAAPWHNLRPPPRSWQCGPAV